MYRYHRCVCVYSDNRVMHRWYGWTDGRERWCWWWGDNGGERGCSSPFAFTSNNGLVTCGISHDDNDDDNDNGARQWQSVGILFGLICIIRPPLRPDNMAIRRDISNPVTAFAGGNPDPARYLLNNPNLNTSKINSSLETSAGSFGVGYVIFLEFFIKYHQIELELINSWRISRDDIMTDLPKAEKRYKHSYYRNKLIICALIYTSIFISSFLTSSLSHIKKGSTGMLVCQRLVILRALRPPESVNPVPVDTV